MKLTVKEEKTPAIFSGPLKSMLESVNGSERIHKNLFLYSVPMKGIQDWKKLANILYLVNSGGNHSLKL
jgi:hypothetical protein